MSYMPYGAGAGQQHHQLPGYAQRPGPLPDGSMQQHYTNAPPAHVAYQMSYNQYAQQVPREHINRQNSGLDSDLESLTEGGRKRRASADSNGFLKKQRSEGPSYFSGSQDGAEGPDEDDEQRRASRSDEGDDAYAYVDDSLTGVLERNITEEQAARDLKKVQDMWEMATALQLLKIIKLMRSSGIHTMGGKKYAESSYSMAMLEDAIVRSPGPGLLAEVHMDLLSALTKSNVTENNWAALLAGRLTLGCTSPMHPRDSLPFAPPRGREAATYATLPVENRVQALKLLCDLRADKDDVRDALDAAVYRTGKEAAAAPPPPAPTGKKGQHAPAVLDRNQLQPELIGTDSAGSSYWWLDCWEGKGTGRLYKEEEEEEEEEEAAGANRGRAGTSSNGAAAGHRSSAQVAAPVPAHMALQAGPGAVAPPMHGLPPGLAAMGGALGLPPGLHGGLLAGGLVPPGLQAQYLAQFGVPGVFAGPGGASILAAVKVAPQPAPRQARQDRAKRMAYLAAYQVCEPPEPSKWELVAEGEDEVVGLGKQLAASREAEDQALAQQIQQQLGSLLAARREEEERLKAKAARAARHLGLVGGQAQALDVMSVGGRSMRQRKTINYNFEEFDHQIEQGIRSTRRRGQLDPAGNMISRQQPAQLPPLREGSRRGRSAGLQQQELQQLEQQQEQEQELLMQQMQQFEHAE